MTRLTKILLIFLFLAAFYPITRINGEEALDWLSCVNEAKKNHPDLVSASEKVKQAKATKEITRSAFLPLLGFDASEVTTKNASFGASGSSVELVSTGSNRKTAYQYEGTAQQLLFDSFRTAYDLSSNERTVVAQKYNYDVTSSNVRLRLRTAYVQLLTAQEYLNIVREIEARRKTTSELVKLRYEGGREHKGSLMTSESNLAQAIYEVAQATRNIYLYQRQLTKELGRSKFSPMTVSGELDVKEADRPLPDLEMMAETNPFLRQLIAQKEAAKFSLKSAYSQLFPTVYANASVGNTGTQWFPDKNEYSIGTSVTMPLFDGSKYAGIDRAKGVLGQAVADEKSGKDGVIYTLANMWSRLQDAIDNVAVQKKSLDAARERARIASAEYSIGLLSYDNWIIIEDNFVSAKKSYINARLAAMAAEANWVQAKGGTLDYDQK